LVDPNTLREDGTAALSSVHLSDDASKMAYMVAFSGSDWQTIKVMYVRTCVSACVRVGSATYTTLPACMKNICLLRTLTASQLEHIHEIPPPPPPP
jgi:hypothetical protein